MNLRRTRVIVLSTTWYVYADDVSAESLRVAASTARAISEGAGASQPVAVGGVRRPEHDLYPVATVPTEVPVDTKVDLLGEIDAYARARDPRIRQVMASDQERFKRFFHGMLEEGVYLAPSAFEAGFVSSAHGDAEIDATLEAAGRTLAALEG